MAVRTPWLLMCLALPSVALGQDEAEPASEPEATAEEAEAPVDEAGDDETVEEAPAEEAPAEEAPAEEAPAELEPPPPPVRVDPPPAAESSAPAEQGPSVAGEGEAQPVPVPPSTGQASVPTFSPPAQEPARITVFGEIRTELSLARLDYLDSRTPGKSPTLSVGLSRALVGAKAELENGLQVKLSLWSSIDPVLEGGQEGPELLVDLYEAYARYDFGKAGALVAGHQELPFGIGQAYGEWFDFPGAQAYFDLSMRSGVSVPAQTALSWQLDLPAEAELDVAVAQPEAGSQQDQPWSSDFAARLRWHPDAMPVFAGASLLYKSRDMGHTDGAWHAYVGASLDPAHLRLLGEVLGTAGDDENSLGFGLDISATADLDLGRVPAESATVVARFERWDEDRDLDLDEVWSAALGAHLDLDTGASNAPFSLGLLYELTVPMDPALAIQHDLTVQARAAF